MSTTVEVARDNGEIQKYEVLKPITVDQFLQDEACLDGITKFITEFGYDEARTGANAPMHIQWADRMGYIPWLVRHGYYKLAKLEETYRIGDLFDTHLGVYMLVQCAPGMVCLVDVAPSPRIDSSRHGLGNRLVEAVHVKSLQAITRSEVVQMAGGKDVIPLPKGSFLQVSIPAKSLLRKESHEIS